MPPIDETALTPIERLGLAYCRLEGLKWDEYIGPKPKGFDEARNDVKRFVVEPHLQRISAMLGETYIDRCRWVYSRQLDEADWLKLQARLWEEGVLQERGRRNDVTNSRRCGISLSF